MELSPDVRCEVRRYGTSFILYLCMYDRDLLADGFGVNLIRSFKISLASDRQTLHPQIFPDGILNSLWLFGIEFNHSGKCSVVSLTCLRMT